MWGAKSGSGYSDQMYRDRNAGGFETKGKCCCFYLTRSVVVILATSVIIAAGAASVLAVVFGYKERWTYGVNRNVNPAFNIRTGWLYFSDNRGADKLKLDQLSKACYILGIVGVAMNCLSAIIALWTGIKAVCGRVGRGFSCFAVIFSILLIGTMLAYYIVTALQVYKFSQRLFNNEARFPWPDWAWCLSAGSALLWLIAAGLASAMPTKSKYFAEEAEFQRQRLDPERPYQVPPPPIARGTPVDSFVPSTMEPNQSTRNVPPLASQENVDHGTEPKKSFMPSWTKRNSNSTEPNIPARSGNLKSRADEIRDRYRNQGQSADVEMGSANTTRPKSAW